MNPVLKLIASLGPGTLLALCPGCSTKASAEGSPAQTAPTVSTVALTVEGMTCASCAVAVRTTLEKLDGVREARVSIAEKEAVVDYEPAKVAPERMLEAVNGLGYKASLAPKRPDSRQKSHGG